MATKIAVDGTRTELVLRTDGQLKQLQEAVSGYIQLVYIKDKQQILVCNEEGLIHDLPINLVATEIATGWANMDGGIRGDVVLCSYQEMAEDDDD